MKQNYHSTDTKDAPEGSPSWRRTAEPFAPPSASSHHVAARGFGQMFGLHPGIAFLTFIIDAMLFGAEAGSLGTSFPISVAASVVLGFLAYRAQMKWFGDDSENAALKAGILAFLTAIPTPLPALVYVPSGIVGVVHLMRRKD
jgi:hypothetical protein